MKQLIIMFNLLVFIFLTSSGLAQNNAGTSISVKRFFEMADNRSPNYSQVKAAFDVAYGVDTANWPAFINEMHLLNKDWETWKKTQPFPEYALASAYLNESFGLGKNPDYYSSYVTTFKNSKRSYCGMLQYFTIGPTGWGHLEEAKDAVYRSFYDGYYSDGLLAKILYYYCVDIPEGMLAWYFSEVFIVINHLHSIDDASKMSVALNAVKKQIKNLQEKGENLKAYLWARAMYYFTKNNKFDEIKPLMIPEIYNLNQLYDQKLATETNKKWDQEFIKIFNAKLSSALHGYSFDVIHPFKYDNKNAGRVYFDRNNTAPYFGKFDVNEAFRKEYNSKSDYGIRQTTFDHILVVSFSVQDKTNNLKQQGSWYLQSEKYNCFLIQINKEGIQPYLYLFDEHSSSRVVDLHISHPSYFYIDITDERSLVLPIPDYAQKHMWEAVMNSLIRAADEFVKAETILLDIPGLDYTKNLRQKTELKATPSNSDIKADGQSTIKITGQLYEYTPGEKNSSKPLAGKTLSFKIKEMDGIKPGKLSALSATTDANGMATVTYIAPTTELLEKMQPFNRISTSVIIRNQETGVEDIAYITFQTDRGEVFVEPAMGTVSDSGIVPPDKRYPALISCYFEDEDLEPIANSEVTFSIAGNSKLGMLRAPDGREGTKLTVMSDSQGMAEINYFYAANAPPLKPITETIEARTANMTIPLKASVAIGFNIVLENVENGYEGKGVVNAGEEIPLRIKVRDEWNQDLDLAQVMNYWGGGDKTGNNRLYVKLEIEKQGFAPKYMLDLLGSQNFPEPLYKELLYPRTFKESENKNLMYIPESSLKTYGFPRVKPMFSGVNNYEVRVLLTDEKGETIFESQHPRQSTFISIPTGLPADSFSIWFVSNPLGPHTPQSRFFRMVLGTVSFGSYGGFGSIISLADAAFAINEGNSEALANVMLAEMKNKVFGDASEKTGLSAETIKIYSNMAVVEQHASFALTSHSDKGLITQMENKIFSGIANFGFGNDKQMVVLKGDGSQKLFIEAGQKPESEVSKALKDNFKIKISGFDKNTKDLIKKVGKNISKKGTEIPFEEEKYIYDKKLNTISLKKGNVTVFVIPKGIKVNHENAIEMKVY